MTDSTVTPNPWLWKPRSKPIRFIEIHSTRDDGGRRRPCCESALHGSAVLNQPQPHDVAFLGQGRRRCWADEHVTDGGCWHPCFSPHRIECRGKRDVHGAAERAGRFTVFTVESSSRLPARLLTYSSWSAARR